MTPFATVADDYFDLLRYFANSSIWAPPVVRDQPTVPQYRTTPITAPSVKGYEPPGTGSRTKPHKWRRLPGVPMPQRVQQ